MNKFDSILKENGKLEPYSRKKAESAIERTMEDCNYEDVNKNKIKSIVDSIEKKLNPENVTTEDWANAAYEVLKEVDETLADAYVDRRYEKMLSRMKSSPLMKAFNDVLFSAGDDPNSINTENANIDGFNPAAQLHRIGSEANKSYVLDYLLPKQFSKPHKDKDIHIHDLDYFELNPNCLQIDLKRLLERGFNTGYGTNTEPHSVLTACMLAAIVLQSSTNQMHGGQSISNLDFAIAKYVNISFRNNFKQIVESYYEADKREIPKYLSLRIINSFYYGITIEDIKAICDREFENDKRRSEDKRKYERKLTKSELNDISRFLKVANKQTEKDTKQGAQSLCHNLCTLHSRAGDQVPFGSCNLGLDTSQAGRLFTKSLIEVFSKGFPDGGIFIYPIIIFHCLDGISYYPTDPNYDLFVMAMKSSAIAFYPNYNFLNSPFQYQYLRDKRGRLLWKTREDWYVSKGLADKRELDSIVGEDETLESNIIMRIRKINEIDRNLRKNYKKNKDVIFDVAAFVNGTRNKVVSNRANNKGSEFPVGDDSLKEGLDDRTIATRMGCRTLTISDNLVRLNQYEEPSSKYKFDRDTRPPYATAAGRGNFSFITLNLPRYAIEASRKYQTNKEKAESLFYEKVLRNMIIAKNILRFKQNIIGNKPGKNYQFIVGEGLVAGSDKISPDDKTNELWEHFSKSIGYIGLYEVTKILYEDNQINKSEKDIEIISFMRKVTDLLSKGYYVVPTDSGLKNPDWFKEMFDVSKSTYSKKNKVKSDWDEKFQVVDINDNPIYLSDKNRLKKGNWSLFATPAESTCKTFRDADYKKFGSIKDVTDKDYYTNSNHLDVRECVTAKEKVEYEAPYHTLTNAGNISYIEMDGLVSQNIKAYKNVLKIMHDNECGYCAVNIPLDTCPICRYRGEIPDGEPCPMCGNDENNGGEPIWRVRRVTGYITPSGKIGKSKGSRMNQGKRSEVKNRVKHVKAKL